MNIIQNFKIKVGLLNIKAPQIEVHLQLVWQVEVECPAVMKKVEETNFKSL